jgi:hypothetical protein
MGNTITFNYLKTSVSNVLGKSVSVVAQDSEHADAFVAENASGILRLVKSRDEIVTIAEETAKNLFATK